MARRRVASIIEDAKIGKGTIVRDFVNLYGCEIGKNCRIAAFVEIQRGVRVGNRCKIQAFAYLPTGVTIEDEVFIGPHVTFTNDKLPDLRASSWEVVPTRVCRGAVIGAGATILCGVTIGERAVVGASAVVTRDVPPGATVVGNPARALRAKQRKRRR